MVLGGVLYVFGTGRADDLRSELNGLRGNWFAAAVTPSLRAEDEQKAWDAIAAKANRICTDPAEAELNLRVAFPQDRAEFVRSVGAVLERERVKLAALRVLQPPPIYQVAYAQFLHQREAALLALERLQRAVQTQDRRKAVRAVRSALLLEASIDSYVQSAGMPACRV